jgi:hypothetical protein
MNYQISLPVSILREGKRYVAFSPVLDISTSGRTEKEVKKRFAELVNIFLEETHGMGTLGSVLQSLGWQKVKQEWKPPRLVSQQTNRVKIPA